MTTATLSSTSPAGRVLALAATETRLVLRNRTVAVSSILVPLALGVLWSHTFPSGGRRHHRGAAAGCGAEHGHLRDAGPC